MLENFSEAANVAFIFTLLNDGGAPIVRCEALAGPEQVRAGRRVDGRRGELYWCTYVRGSRCI